MIENDLLNTLERRLEDIVFLYKIHKEKVKESKKSLLLLTHEKEQLTKIIDQYKNKKQ